PVAGHHGGDRPGGGARLYDPGPAAAVGPGLVGGVTPPRRELAALRPPAHPRPELPRRRLTARGVQSRPSAVTDDWRSAMVPASGGGVRPLTSAASRARPVTDARCPPIR